MDDEEDKVLELVEWADNLGLGIITEEPEDVELCEH